VRLHLSGTLEHDHERVLTLRFILQEEVGKT